jgi:hypothetical protein
VRSSSLFVVEDGDSTRPACRRPLDLRRETRDREPRGRQRIQVPQLLDLAVADFGTRLVSFPQDRGIAVLGVPLRDDRRWRVRFTRKSRREYFWQAGNELDRVNPADPNNLQGIWKTTQYDESEFATHDWRLQGDALLNFDVPLRITKLNSVTMIGYQWHQSKSADVESRFPVLPPFTYFNLTAPNPPSFVEKPINRGAPNTLRALGRERYYEGGIYGHQELGVFNDRLRLMHYLLVCRNSFSKSL